MVCRTTGKWKSTRKYLSAACLSALFGTGAAHAAQPEQDPPPPPVVEVAPAPVEATPADSLFTRPKLTGDWNGIRTKLAERGISWDVSATNFYSGVTSGGLDRQFQFGGRADYILNVDGHKLGLWEGFFVAVHAETLYGKSSNAATGALLPTSIGQTLPNSSPPITALTGVKIVQALSPNFLLFFGKLNTLDEFNQPFTGGARGTNGFMTTGLLLPPVLARTIPYSTFGGGLAVLREGQPVFTLSFFDVNNTPTTSGFDSFFDRGVSIYAQATLPTKIGDLPGHYSVGGVYSTAQYAALDDLPYFLIQRFRGEFPPLPRETGSWSVYGLFDQAFYVDACNPKRSWGLFGSAGISDGNPNPIRWSSSIGVGGSSLLKNRPLDSFGVGYFYVGLSDDLKAIAPRVNRIRDEHGVELFYNAAVTPWCHVTPDLQIVTPARSRVETSVNFGLRMKIDF